MESRQTARTDEAAERELVARCRKGDARAFDALMEAHTGRVYRLAWRLSGKAEDADALTQDVFVQAFRSIRQFDGRSRLMTWLYSITVRKALDLRRARRRQAILTLGERLDPAVDLRRPVSQDPARALEEKELNEALDRAILRLPADQGAALALVAQEGMSYREAARALGCSQGTVAWRVWNARRLLRAMLGGRLEG
mgnify:CR=1 FL=1